MTERDGLLSGQPLADAGRLLATLEQRGRALEAVAALAAAPCGACAIDAPGPRATCRVT